MASETEIVNVGLRLIGGARITSLTDGSKNANVAKDIYDAVRDDLLRSHKWNFAEKLASLARLSTAPTFEFDYAYALPADWMRTVSVHDNDAGSGALNYEEAEVAGVGALLCSSETVYLKYIYKVTDPNRMPADFRKALSTSLARDMAIPIANSNTLHDAFEKRSTRDINRAKSADALGSPPPRRPPGSWASSRQSWPSSRWPR